MHAMLVHEKVLVASHKKKMRTKYLWIKNCEVWCIDPYIFGDTKMLCVVIVLKPKIKPKKGFKCRPGSHPIPGDPTLQHAWIMMPNASQSLKDRFPGIPFQYVAWCYMFKYLEYLQSLTAWPQSVCHKQDPCPLSSIAWFVFHPTNRKLQDLYFHLLIEVHSLPSTPFPTVDWYIPDLAPNLAFWAALHVLSLLRAVCDMLLRPLPAEHLHLTRAAMDGAAMVILEWLMYIALIGDVDMPTDVYTIVNSIIQV